MTDSRKTLDARSKRVLFAWIASDIAWAILFINARKRHENGSA